MVQWMKVGECNSSYKKLIDIVKASDKIPNLFMGKVLERLGIHKGHNKGNLQRAYT